MPIIIDGYNLLRLIQSHTEDYGSISDVGMCRLLGQYLELVSQAGQIVFDGIGPPEKTGFYNIASLEVIFSGRHTDADTVIEDKIKASTAPRSLSIVSSDRRLRSAARARRAESIPSDEFWAMVEKQLSRKRRDREPGEKYRGLSESETQQWLDFFNLDE